MAFPSLCHLRGEFLFTHHLRQCDDLEKYCNDEFSYIYWVADHCAISDGVITCITIFNSESLFIYWIEDHCTVSDGVITWPKCRQVVR